MHALALPGESLQETVIQTLPVGLLGILVGWCSIQETVLVLAPSQAGTPSRPILPWLLFVSEQHILWKTALSRQEPSHMEMPKGWQTTPYPSGRPQALTD